MTTWNETFESTPSDLSHGYDGDDAIRAAKVAIRERLELEHDFKANGSPYHKAGKCSVLFVGTTLEISEMLDGGRGSIAYDSTLKILKVYNGTTWEVMASIHSQLDGLAQDDHPQYLKLDKVGQTLSQSLAVINGKKIGGRYVGVEGGRLEAFITKNSGSTNLTFVAATKEVLRSSGSFITDGFAVGDVIYTTSLVNPGPFVIAVIHTTFLNIAETPVDEGPIEATVVVERRRFVIPSGGFAITMEYGPETRDCFVFAYASGDTIYFYSGATTANFLVNTCRAGSAAFMPVRRGHKWKIAQNTSASKAVIHRMQIY